MVTADYLSSEVSVLVGIGDGTFQTAMHYGAGGGTASGAINVSTNGTASTSNTIAFNQLHHKLIVDNMKERNIPAYVGDDYMAIAWPSTPACFDGIENWLLLSATSDPFLRSQMSKSCSFASLLVS